MRRESHGEIAFLAAARLQKFGPIVGEIGRSAITHSLITRW
jgi:hypothetical protein